MGPYRTLESWASRLGYIVERTESGWAWHRENESVRHAASEKEVVESILSAIRDEYVGGD